MDLGISGKVALVTGGSAGLGRAVALALAREGVHLAVSARREKDLMETVALVRDAGGSATPLIWDLSDPSLLDEMISSIERTVGPIDILFNNTGGPPPGAAAGHPRTAWTAQFEALVTPSIAVTDRVLPGMRARRWGRIITNASTGVIAPIPNLAFSNSLRSALVGWSKTLAREVAGDGVTVNIVAPGRFDTDRVRSVDALRAQQSGLTPEAVTKASLAAIPASRLGDPAEFGATVAYLSSQHAAYITGSVVRVDGGVIASV